MSTPEPVLDVSGLEVRYGSIAAVRGLDLSVEQGEIVGLIGPNGAGSRRRCTPSWALYDRAPEMFASAVSPSAVTPGENRSRRDRSRSRGKAHLCGANGRGQPASRALGTSDEIRRCRGSRGRLRALSHHRRDSAPSRRASFRRSATTARDRPRSGRRAGRPAARRALARAGTDRGGHRLRGAQDDSGAWRHDSSRRAARTAHGCARG